jgi:hypothetical protein
MRRHEAPVPAPRMGPSAHRLPVRQAASRPGRLNSAQLAGRLAALQRRTQQEPGREAPAAEPATASPPLAAPANSTGLPDRLKAGVEALSGFSMDDVKVHYGSAKPARLQALAYTRGTDIHVGPGQEKHLAHEAWHIVQQKQGRVGTTRQLKGLGLNDDPSLEAEADRMGAIAETGAGPAPRAGLQARATGEGPVQRRAGIEYETMIPARRVPPAVVPPQQPVAPNDNSLWITQNEVMANGAGWDVVCDNSKLEFVTDPPVTVPALRGVVNNLFGVLNAIPAPLGAVAGFQAHIGIAPLHPYNILPYPDTFISGKMQGTIGIDFAKVPAFLNLLTTHNLSAADARHRAYRQAFPNPNPRQTEVIDDFSTDTKALSEAKQQAVSDVIGEVDQLTQPLRARLNQIPLGPGRTAQAEQHEKLRGLLMLVGQYIKFSANYTHSYAKKSFPIMARTSFSSMYKALPNHMKREFLPLARQLVLVLNRQLNDVAFGQHANQLDVDARFTLGEWLDSIVVGGQRMIPGATRNDPARQVVSDRMTAPGVARNPTDASMGSMGLDQGKVVMEMRGLSGGHTPRSLRAFVTDLAALEAAPIRP